MAMNSMNSFLLASVLTIILFSGMQMYKPVLVKSPFAIIFGGYLGSILFLLFITAVGNLESVLFGKNAQVRFPEVILCLSVALISSGMVHRICLTTCFLFSMLGLYYVNRISQKVYAAPVPTATAQIKSRRHK